MSGVNSCTPSRTANQVPLSTYTYLICAGFVRDIALSAVPLPQNPRLSRQLLQQQQQQQRQSADAPPPQKRRRLAPNQSQSLADAAQTSAAAVAKVPAVHRGQEGVLASDSDDEVDADALATVLAPSGLGASAPQAQSEGTRTASPALDIMASDTMAALRLLHAEARPLPTRQAASDTPTIVMKYNQSWQQSLLTVHMVSVSRQRSTSILAVFTKSHHRVSHPKG